MRSATPLLAAYAVVQVPVVPEFDAKLAYSALSISANSYKQWSKVPVTERADTLRRSADALQAELPRFCALLFKEAFKTWGDAVGEVRELVTGDPADLATDVGAVIDREAFEGIQRHITRLQTQARDVLAPGRPMPAAAGQATVSTSNRPAALIDQAQVDTKNVASLIEPQAFEVSHMAELQDEIFGPVLHIVRWKGDPLAVVAQINALGSTAGPGGATPGYGLTMGIQTRIDSRAQQLARAAHIGNVYINRNQIGAVVGVQPFGGEGLSGTGPKAGGPHYLYRFCAEQTVTINTTAAGGNVQLMA